MTVDALEHVWNSGWEIFYLRLYFSWYLPVRTANVIKWNHFCYYVQKGHGFEENLASVIVSSFLIFMFVDQLLLVDVFSQLYYVAYAKKQQCRTYHYKSLKSWKINNIDLTQQFSLSISTDFRYQSIKITWLLLIFINWPLRVVCLKPTVNFENQRYLALLTCSLMAESINLGFSSTLIIPNITKTGFILAIGQWGSNGPPSVIEGTLFQERGVPKRYLNLLVQTVPWENEHLLKLSFTDLQVLSMRLKWL